MSGKLTAKQAEHAKPGKHGDGNGLTLLVQPSGARSWVVRYRDAEGKRRDKGIGGYPAVSLSEARKTAEAIHAASAAPEPEAAPEPMTFSEAARMVCGTLEAKWRDPLGEGRAFRRSLELHAGPLMAKPCNAITRADVLDVLLPIWNDKPATAQRVRQRVKLIMSTVMAYDETMLSNPAGEGIDGVLRSWTGRRTVAHHRAVAAHEVAEVLDIVSRGATTKAVSLCLRFLVLTAARSKEAREARWAEMDVDGRCWLLPPERTKQGTAHRVPLSDAAVDVLIAAKGLDDGSGYVFPSPNRTSAAVGRPLGDSTLRKALSENAIEGTVHGFRSTFRDWALKQPGVSFEAAERALAHTIGTTVTAAYLRDDLFAERAVLMAAWADYVGR
ncbi:MAG: tyrosine-type recombinase/integrase [Gemmatimonadetes bacterium]|nr:tyrosine-type recombinase/integrase [Gemmatimonadota bacterium]MYF92395.1 tyrosine-type recombinase/integrase [Gemmatimonadota bacterium]MYI06491.1 tyrosine-type recombinase/integrase [Gemmatimonadota bacterium]